MNRKSIEEFALGALAAIAPPVATALVQFDAPTVLKDPGKWGLSVGTGIVVALGLYLRRRVTLATRPE